MLPNVKEAIARLEVGIAGKESYEMTEVSVANLRVVLEAVKTGEDAEFLKMLQEAIKSGTGIIKDGKHVPASEIYAQPTAGAVPAMTDAETDAELAKVDRDVAAMGIGFMVDGKRVPMSRLVWFNRPGETALPEYRALLAALPQQFLHAGYQFQARDGSWMPFMDQRHYENTVADGTWPIRAIYVAAEGEDALPQQAAPAIPEGWALVPTKYTTEMRHAWDSAPQSDDDGRDFSNAYAAMLAAAPQPPVSVWTACAKQKPKQRGPYLVYHPRFPETIRIVNYGTSQGWENGRDKTRPAESRITHWMPLPQPPAPEGGK